MSGDVTMASKIENKIYLPQKQVRGWARNKVQLTEYLTASVSSREHSSCSLT
jgi:hypothetical protein